MYSVYSTLPLSSMLVPLNTTVTDDAVQLLKLLQLHQQGVAAYYSGARNAHSPPFCPTRLVTPTCRRSRTEPRSDTGLFQPAAVVHRPR